MPITDWGTPASGDTVGTYTPTVNTMVSYVGGYWFAVSHSGSSLDAHKVRYATTPSGAWTTVSLPAAPTGYSYYGVPYPTSGVDFDGTNYALVVSLTHASDPPIQRILYCTDPTGSWSLYDHDTTNAYRLSFLRYLDSQWVAAGRLRSTATAVIAYCSTLTGAWTFDSTNTGYGANRFIVSMDWDGSTYVSCAGNSSGGAGEVRHSSALLSGWAAPASCTLTGDPRQVVRQSNGYWTVVDPSAGTIRYAATPSGTWGTVTAADLGLATNATQTIAYGGGYWVAGGGPVDGSYRVPTVTYLASTGDPSGTYTEAVDTFTEPADNIQVRHIIISGSSVLAVSDYYSELRYSDTTRTPRPFPRPRGLPGNPKLRQRQTPIITK